ncbi:MAG: hypothetical protein R2857_15955 [Vampirovibrionales bacterium]
MVDHEYRRLFDTTRIEHLPDTAAKRLWSDDPELLDALPMIAGKIDPQLSGFRRIVLISAGMRLKFKRPQFERQL